MSIRVVSIESMLNERRQRLQQAGTVETRVPYLYGENRFPTNPNYVSKRIVNGEMEVYDFTRPVGEMITTPAGRRELLEKVVLDVELGREQVPLLYTPIYDRLEDPNFPEVFDAPWATSGTVVFFSHMEGEEVKFGHIQAEQGPTARIVTYAAGFEFTEKMILFNQTFAMEELERAFGEAYNALLNHIHLSPIITFNYTGKNVTAARSVDPEGKPLSNSTNSTGAHPLLSMRATLSAAIEDAARERRPGNILIIASANQRIIQDALAAMHVRGTDYGPVSGIDTIIAYDGWSTRVGKRLYTYEGADATKAWLVRPRRGFKELVKYDLMIDAGDADLSRLVDTQVVGRAYRGTYAALQENVQEIELPQFS
ncbi:MAG TPA: aspartate ammonia-lyase [Bacillota bacterium]|nr:aspartate ammonia-lyase [Bacillota bacterium]